jgi:hypothetical protein
MELLDEVERLLLEEDIRCERNEKRRQLSTYMNTGAIGSHMVITESRSFIKCVILIPIFAPPDRRASMAEAVCRANYGLHIGAFEIDLSDGEIRFRSALPTVDAHPSREALRCLTFFSCNVVSRYTTAFGEVVFKGADPKQAIETAEAEWQEESRKSREEERLSLSRPVEPTMVN